MLSLAIRARDGEAARARILAALRGQPGLNKSRLCGEVGLSWATVAYHLRVLERLGAVNLERHGRRDVACFAVGVPSRYRRMFATLLDANAARIMQALGHDRALGVTEISQQVHLSQATVRRQLARMRERGLVVKQGKLRPRFTANPEARQAMDETLAKPR